MKKILRVLFSMLFITMFFILVIDKEIVTQKDEIPFSGKMALRLQNMGFLYDFFRQDIPLTMEYWGAINSGLKKIILISITNQELTTLSFTDTFRVMLNTKVSTGRFKGWTPTGKFKICDKRKSRPSYKYHSIMDKWNSITEDEKFAIHGLKGNKDYEKDLGKPASHGCIRISNSVAPYFYEIASIDTIVLIETLELNS